MAFVTPAACILALVPYYFLTRSGIPPTDDTSRVDERQWRVRAEATTIAYRILGLGMLVLALAGGAYPLPWNQVAFVAMVLIVCLPAAVLGWREPDLPQDEA